MQRISWSGMAAREKHCQLCLIEQRHLQMKLIGVVYFSGREGKQGEICLFLLFREWQHGTPGWPIWMTKVVKLYMVIAVDETGTVLLPFPHILVNTEQIPTSYKVFESWACFLSKFCILLKPSQTTFQCHKKNQNQKIKLDSKYYCKSKTCWFCLF